MATKEERLRILKLVQDGKVSPDEAAQLMEAIDAPAQPEPVSETPAPTSQPAKTGRWFHVKVTNTLSGKTMVNVRLPISLIKVGMKMGSKFSPEMQEMDMDQVMEFINSGEIGQLVDVTDEDDSEHVEVSIE